MKSQDHVLKELDINMVPRKKEAKVSNFDYKSLKNRQQENERHTNRGRCPIKSDRYTVKEDESDDRDPISEYFMHHLKPKSNDTRLKQTLSEIIEETSEIDFGITSKRRLFLSDSICGKASIQEKMSDNATAVLDLLESDRSNGKENACTNIKKHLNKPLQGVRLMNLRKQDSMDERLTHCKDEIQALLQNLDKNLPKMGMLKQKPNQNHNEYSLCKKKYPTVPKKYEKIGLKRINKTFEIMNVSSLIKYSVKNLLSNKNTIDKSNLSLISCFNKKKNMQLIDAKKHMRVASSPCSMGKDIKKRDLSQNHTKEKSVDYRNSEFIQKERSKFHSFDHREPHVYKKSHKNTFSINKLEKLSKESVHLTMEKLKITKGIRL